MKEVINELNAGAINAGAFNASDTKKPVILKQPDIALTAVSNGDIYGPSVTLSGSHLSGKEWWIFNSYYVSYQFTNRIAPGCLQLI